MWQKPKDKIKVVLSFRDLGAHVNTTSSINSTTLNDRVTESTTATYKLDKLPVTHEEKANGIRARIMPKAVYGAEVARPSEDKQKKLRDCHEKYHLQCGPTQEPRHYLCNVKLWRGPRSGDCNILQQVYNHEEGHSKQKPTSIALFLLSCSSISRKTTSAHRSSTCKQDYVTPHLHQDNQTEANGNHNSTHMARSALFLPKRTRKRPR